MHPLPAGHPASVPVPEMGMMAAGGAAVWTLRAAPMACGCGVHVGARAFHTVAASADPDTRCILPWASGPVAASCLGLGHAPYTTVSTGPGQVGFWVCGSLSDLGGLLTRSHGPLRFRGGQDAVANR